VGAGGLKGLNISGGKIYHEGVSSAFDMELTPIQELALAEGRERE
jgi:hypothetical protein